MQLQDAALYVLRRAGGGFSVWNEPGNLRLGKVGFGARTESEWVESMAWILDHTDRGREMGVAGRKIIEERYSLSLLAPRLASYLRGFGRH
jgi:hypothetical protein